ncbi:ABC transporter ATP-binding protein [Pseudomonas aeruginosa]|uniref:ABC transporter ATP-binding protein n=2 Tax=Pseudomonas aeruginosa TaxID=287 RepID=UPI0003B9C078|nr:ABC transporter ATP-binding protein [Pseudomonas aeruginosa]EKU7806349.1 ABC transporter ATP-binding protein [Pseudomonas aeruginosa]EKV3150404.1 ABC transporter ATP-binding protein [Pseudomonas aeruginosa]EKV6520236.1 ABC transporter ATP-binding protein [Pseudomonas aeruginosa]EKW5134783.1 ABC transporter ATP-binding protein [Pseudomonas aeruginosa]EKX3871771.1 ABC transporter ATP-binding protein [Pseudomonas aeruginosa]
MSALHSLRTHAVSIRAVRKVYGDPESGPVALKRVDLDIRDNEFFTLLGPSGCGKTTLLRMIAGFEFPTEGEILLYGENIAARPPFERPVNTVFQHYALFPHMSIAENLAFGLESRPLGRSLGKAEIAERVREMLALVQMERFADRRPGQLSGGQQQRVALARALAPQPRVLLLDEPLSALDLKLRQAMREELKAIQAKTGITFIFVTHDQEEALTMSDRIAVLSEGQVQQVGPPEEIYERPGNRFVADFIGETNFIEAELLQRDGPLALYRGPGGEAFEAAARDDLAAGARVCLSIRPERLDLLAANTGGGLPCTVESQVYLGTDLQYRVRLADGSLLTVRTPNGTARRFATGEAACLAVAKDSASVLLD